MLLLRRQHAAPRFLDPDAPFRGCQMRWLSAKLSHEKQASFSDSLLLPKTAFPLRADLAKSTETFREKTTQELYRRQWKNASGPLFVLHDGPPYANGSIHIGHALNKVIKDIIIRFRVLQGKRVSYLPGWDCHGLPIENKTLKDLGKDSASLPPNAIRDAAKATAEREMAIQRKEFQELGIMADWSEGSTYRTLDHAFEIRQLRIFQAMVEKGLIYRQYRPVYYSPSSRSALAEAELLYKDDHISHSVYVVFKMGGTLPASLRALLKANPLHLLVWTTTPWTLTANMGIAVRQDLTYSVMRGPDKFCVVAKDRLQHLQHILGEYEEIAVLQGSDLMGLSYLPLLSRDSSEMLPILHAAHVTSESGTGLVHCAPAHGAEDYHLFSSLGRLDASQTIICHVDGEGKFNHEAAAFDERLVGTEVLGLGSRMVVQVLKELGALVKIERYKHRYPYDWKTDAPVIVTATHQWFANLEQIKDKAIDALSTVKFYPPQSRNRLESFVRSRSEWCISRQRVWGVPIPALYHIPTDTAVLDAVSLDHILAVLDNKGVAHWWDAPVSEFIPPALLKDSEDVEQTWRKGTDTMDVWFDSGSSWALLKERGFARRGGMLADVCLEGTDQHRGWFQSQLLTAIGASSSAEGNDSSQGSPYGALLTHGMVLDEYGKKMSKSLGNVVSPMDVIHGGPDKKKQPPYGVDVLRLWVASAEYSGDMSIGPTVLAQAAESMRKIRNSARFMLGSMRDASEREEYEPVSRDEMTLLDRYVMHELYKLEQTALDGYDNYNFSKVITALNNFTNTTLSSLYFDINKDCLYADAKNSVTRRAVLTVMEQVLSKLTHIVAPVMPHLAEEIHFHHRTDGPATSAFIRVWEPLEPMWHDLQAEKEFDELLIVRSSVLSLLETARGKKELKSSLEAQVEIRIPEGESRRPVYEILTRELHCLDKLFIVSAVTIQTTTPPVNEAELTWAYSAMPRDDGNADERPPDSPEIRIIPSSGHKCPRCWTFTSLTEGDVCNRCADVLQTQAQQ